MSMGCGSLSAANPCPARTGESGPDCCRRESMRKAEESRPRGRHLRSSSSRPAAATPVQANELGWSERTRFLDLNIHITGVQYIRTHPTGSRRPKTALLAVSRSMHWLCLHPHSPFASHSLTDSLTHQICSDPAANHQSARGGGGEGATHARGSDGLTRPTGERKEIW